MWEHLTTGVAYETIETENLNFRQITTHCSAVNSIKIVVEKCEKIQFYNQKNPIYLQKV